MKKERYIVEIEMPDGDASSSMYIQDIIQADFDVEDNGRWKVSVKEKQCIDKDTTNEEKARSLCCSGCNKYQCYTDNGSCVNLKNLIMMAQWKDEQIDTIMLTTEGCLRSFFESQGNTQESIDNFIDALKTQINENLNKL